MMFERLLVEGSYMLAYVHRRFVPQPKHSSYVCVGKCTDRPLDTNEP